MSKIVKIDAHKLTHTHNGVKIKIILLKCILFEDLTQCDTHGVNFINMLLAAFTHADPKNVKRYWQLHWNCTLLGSPHVPETFSTLFEASIIFWGSWGVAKIVFAFKQNFSEVGLDQTHVNYFILI